MVLDLYRRVTEHAEGHLWMESADAGLSVRRHGPTKVHLTTIDHHLWQPFLLEATAQQLLAVLPRGTCGNTVHRMVTNVQRYLDPEVGVWLGSEPYQDAVASSFGAAA